MKIAIDMQGAQTQSRFRGIGRYTISFTKALLRNFGKEYEFILVLSSQFPDTIQEIRDTFNELIPQKNIKVCYTPVIYDENLQINKQNIEIAKIIKEAFLENLNADIIHIPSFFEGYQENAVTSINNFDTNSFISVTIHDLIPLLNKEQYLDSNQSYNSFYQNKLEFIKKSSILLAVSQSSKNEAIRHLNIEENRIFNTLEAVEVNFKKLDISQTKKEIILRKFNIEKPFILYAGGFDERKNLPRLIEAFSKLPQNIISNYQLVFAGKIDSQHILYLEKIARKNNLNKEALVFTNYISDEDLIYLYNLTKLYVFPSWHEGFGLPALEAMACGAAVIGANTSSLPEVIGLEDALFDPFDTLSITNKIKQALEDEDFFEKLKRNAKEQSTKFSWDTTAQKAMNAWQSSLKTITKQNHETNLQKLIEKIAPLLQNLKDDEIVKISHYLALNYPKKMEEKQIFVDISELIQRDSKTGIQRVVRSILKNWLQNPPKGYSIKAVYSTLDVYGYKYATNFTNNFLGLQDKFQTDEYIEYSNQDIFFALDYQAHNHIAQKDFFKHLKDYGVKVIFCVYDLLSITHAKHFPKGGDEVFKNLLSVVIQSNKAICISQSVANELKEYKEQYYKTENPDFKIDFFHLGADVSSSKPTKGLPDTANQTIKILKTKPTFLMVGTLEPRKGHAQVLNAFNILWQENIDINLVIVGKEGWMVENLVKTINSHQELEKRLFWLEAISDEYLEKIYENASCLIAASYGEGFGLPLIEAAQKKLPILARDIPVFKEVAREFAVYFKADTPKDLSNSIKNYLELYEENAHPKSNNMPWLTWKESSEILFNKIIED